MKYSFLALLSIFTISLFGFYDVYASGPLSFDQTRIVLDHSGIISCVGCTDVGNTIQVTLGGGPSGDKSITLYKVSNNPLTYSSSFVKFTSCSSCGSLEYNVNVGSNVTATASGYTSALNGTIFATETMNTDLAHYGKATKLIQPNSYGVCANFGGDTDGDFICDGWENNSNYPATCAGQGLCIRTDSTVTPYYLSCNNTPQNPNDCPSPTKADVYYEIDWMRGHKPGNDVINEVKKVFSLSNYVSKNNVTGIILHPYLDEELPHFDVIKNEGTKLDPGYNQIKYWWFGNATERNYSYPDPNHTTSLWFTQTRSQKAQVFHYAIFAHSYFDDTNSSGISEIPGNDALITLGSFTGKVGSKDQQKATLLHEIGHNLGLDHGGKYSVICKPNYLSVMNPAFQFRLSDGGFVANRPLDFSRSLLTPLNETNLSEPIGINASNPTNLWTVYGPSPEKTRQVGQSFDWNRDGDMTDTGISQDINKFGTTICNNSGNNTQLLTGFKDWNATQIRLGSLGHTEGGEEPPEDRPLPDPFRVDFDPNSIDSGGMGGSEETTIVKLSSNELSSDNIKTCKEGFVLLFRPSGEYGGCFKSEHVYTPTPTDKKPKPQYMYDRDWKIPAE